MQTEIPRRWSTSRPWFLQYADRNTSPLIIIGEIGSFIIQTEIPCRWSSAKFSCHIMQAKIRRRWPSARFWFLHDYTDRNTSPLIIGVILVPLLCRQKYLAADLRRNFRAFIMNAEILRCWSSARFWLLYCTDKIPRRSSSPAGEI